MANVLGDEPSEQLRAYRLLVELLSYQFAFPVRWIDTQRELFDANPTVRRFIEIGPSNVLANMAQKTAKVHYAQKDQSTATERDFLSHVDHRPSIYYEYDAPRVESPSPTSIEDPSPAPDLIATAQPVSLVSTQAPVTVAPVPDTELTPTDIILPLVGQKIRKPVNQVSTQKSIRELSSGKSTLQNELVGDLGAEFGRLPDSAEDLPLESLTASITTFSGRPGKVMTKLIDRMQSSRMPAGFQQADVRGYLSSRWGLGPSRQTAVLCYAVSMEPPTRLTDIDQGRQYFDTVVQEYAAHVGVSFEKPAPGSSVSYQSPGEIVMDQASLDALKKEQNAYLHKQLKVLAQHLNVDTATSASTTDPDTTEPSMPWIAELDQEFLDGIRGIFDAHKARRYDSWWNWARQDMMALLHDLPNSEAQIEQRCRNLINRWSPDLEEMWRFAGQASLCELDRKRLAQYLSTTTSLLERNDAVSAPVYRYTSDPMAPITTVDEAGKIQYSEVPRTTKGAQGYVDIVSGSPLCRPAPYVNLRRRGPAGTWHFHPATTQVYLDTLSTGATSGLSFSGKTVLVTGAGPGSIGVEIVSGLLAGGARVVVTTSRAPSSAASLFSQLYQRVGGAGSELILLPFNQASKQDCEALITYLYNESMDLDYFVPFAAIPENGRELDKLDPRSELAHRLMLVNVLRLLGHIKQQKERRGDINHPTAVVLPLSPNHGTFGGDGLYAESKLGLETLFERYYSESWAPYISILGAVIGWTRGTGLIGSQNLVAQGVEDALDALTFSSAEMGFNLLALMSPAVLALADEQPVYADLSGGLLDVSDLKEKITATRNGIKDKQRLCRALQRERQRHQEVVRATATAAPQRAVGRHRASICIPFPPLPDYTKMTSGLESLVGMVDFSRTVVVVGYSELGPWGSARTRWDMEHQGRLSAEGYTELAWAMNLIEHHIGEHNGEPYVGWVDRESKKPVHEADIERNYGSYILSHAGIRVIEPTLFSDGYDPSRKEFLQEIVLNEDLPPFEAPAELAQAFKRRHGDRVHLIPTGPSPSDPYQVIMRQGTSFLVPKAVPCNRTVAGQLPSGWSPAQYGIPDEVTRQVDPVTVYALCCACEALYSAGIDDPFEMFKYIHVSELANCLGTGAGGLLAMRGVYRERYLDRDVQSDILQESFLNAMGAWTNMLLLGATGPIKTPSGTCATAVESMDIACEAIQTRKARIALVGGSDDFQAEMSYEFANMKATANAEDEMAKGFLPSEMSRPTSSSRSGFVESAGCGVQLLMSAELALEMGLPIYAIVAHTQMSGDRIGRSVPAPGQGVLTAAREVADAVQSPLLDLGYRRAQLQKAVADIHSTRRTQLQGLTRNPQRRTESTTLQAQAKQINDAAACRVQDAQWMWNGNLRQLNPSLSPIRAALASWGLTVDDIQVASFHGTSTKANDKNESHVVNQMMQHLGRKLGNPVLVVCQKSLTGHPKGAAGAWMFNGCLQTMQTGIVPGNRNADNIDQALQTFEHLLYPSQTIRLPRIKAFMLTSFGFGQKGGVVVGVAPAYLHASIDKERYEAYRERALHRQRQILPIFQKRLANRCLFQLKDQSAWTAAQESAVFLDSTARVTQKKTGEYGYTSLPELEQKMAGAQAVSIEIPEEVFPKASQRWLQSSVQDDLNLSTGVDIEHTININIDNQIFLQRNFTSSEIEYCQASPDPQSSFAGRWVAKEAVFKSLGIASEGGGAAMKEIEVASNGANAPLIRLHPRLQQKAGVREVQVSITHAGGMAMAVALARKDCSKPVDL